MAAVPSTLPPKPIGEATSQLVVLAFDVLEKEIPNLPNLLQTSLNTKEVKEGIQSALDSFMLKRMTSGAAMHDLSGKDAIDLLNAINSAATGKIGNAALKQIKNTDEYKRLENAFAEFQTSASATPMGVWIDKHSGIVFVTGIALVLSGAAVLYVTRTGGVLTNTVVSQIKNQPIQVFKVGNFTLKGKVLDFKPETRNLGVGVIATESWQGLQVSLEIGAIAAFTTVQQVNGSLVLKVDEVNVGVKVSDDLNKKTVNLGLTLGFDDGPLKPLKVGVGTILSSGKVTAGTLDASLTIPKGELGLRGMASAQEKSCLATWTIHFE